MKKIRSEVIIALQVAPEYRVKFISHLDKILGPEISLKLFSANESLDGQVKAGLFNLHFQQALKFVVNTLDLAV